MWYLRRSARNVPPQLLDAPGWPATSSPAGKVSVKPTPVNERVEFGLVIVKVRVVVPFKGIELAPKAFKIVGPSGISVGRSGPLRGSRHGEPLSQIVDL